MIFRTSSVSHKWKSSSDIEACYGPAKEQETQRNIRRIRKAVVFTLYKASDNLPWWGPDESTCSAAGQCYCRTRCGQPKSRHNKQMLQIRFLQESLYMYIPLRAAEENRRKKRILVQREACRRNVPRGHNLTPKKWSIISENVKQRHSKSDLKLSVLQAFVW